MLHIDFSVPDVLRDLSLRFWRIFPGDDREDATLPADDRTPYLQKSTMSNLTQELVNMGLPIYYYAISHVLDLPDGVRPKNLNAEMRRKTYLPNFISTTAPLHEFP